jgi:hypothetical protein
MNEYCYFMYAEMRVYTYAYADMLCYAVIYDEWSDWVWIWGYTNQNAHAHPIRFVP